jgi:3-aminobutyryl-CoA ammonia-lyase
VQFLAPVRAGDLLEVTAELVAVGRRSRTLAFRAVVVGRGRPDLSASAARMLPDPFVATTATGVVVVPARPSSDPTSPTSPTGPTTDAGAAE